MRALFDVSHPAHVHLFKYAVAELSAEGHDVHIASRIKDVTTDLLNADGLEHTPLSEQGRGGFGLVGEWMGRELRLLRLARRFDPDVVVSMLNPPAAHVSRLLGVPNVVFNDTETAGIAQRITTPFANVVCTPAGFEGNLGARQRRYEGFQELAYLHPSRFERDPEPLRSAGIEPDDPYAVLRFVAMDAHHDIGHDGVSNAWKRKLVERLEEHMPVYVSTETPLPDELASNRIPVPPEDLHQLLAHADLHAGDSGTMTTEAAVLGTPTVRLNHFDDQLGNFRELTEYGLLECVRELPAFVEAAVELAADPDAGNRWEARRRDMLTEKIDVTEFMLETVREVGSA